MGHFQALRAWQKARQFASLSKDAIAELPSSERFGLADQWRRAAYSVPLNLAEGAARRSQRDFRRYVVTARGALDELESILSLVEGLGYLPPDRLAVLKEVRADCGRMVYGLLRKLNEACNV
ncbi:MAG: four helix bundle protein [Gemmatimonadales bacterium]